MSTPESAADQLPIIVGSDGQPYIGCDAAVALLRAIAEACRATADDPDCNLDTIAVAIDQEADALAVRAIAHTA
ncbi:hypothetical protein [Streptomyces sp. WM6349]|uniref:hypothetical protein n=1 Tax=Streptomyces sp. WM6349 TaxID=1415552 RepID=UPI0006ADCF8E|nr:hypothetical protein [Streptomyces sp. WM6349]KOU17041.1 hypothetical protein ADK49_17030 [Streptomyces sp. WM6349]